MVLYTVTSPHHHQSVHDLPTGNLGSPPTYFIFLLYSLLWLVTDLSLLFCFLLSFFGPYLVALELFLALPSEILMAGSGDHRDTGNWTGVCSELATCKANPLPQCNCSSPTDLTLDPNCQYGRKKKVFHWNHSKKSPLWFGMWLKNSGCNCRGCGNLCIYFHISMGPKLQQSLEEGRH